MTIIKKIQTAAQALGEQVGEKLSLTKRMSENTNQKTVPEDKTLEARQTTYLEESGLTDGWTLVEPKEGEPEIDQRAADSSQNVNIPDDAVESNADIPEIDENGNLVDKNGNRIDENGNLIDKDQ